MIKVNLLPSRSLKRKRGASPGSVFLLVLLTLVFVVGGLLYMWNSALVRERNTVAAAVREIQSQVERLQRVRRQIEEDEAQRALLTEQNRILESLKAGKVGPPNMLLFFAYALTQPADTLANREELKAMEQAGWNMYWDSDSVSLQRIREDDRGIVTIQGVARSHEDAAEFYQRLRSSIYLQNLEPRRQERRFEPGVELNYIAFEGRAEINYRLPPRPADEQEDGAGGDEASAVPPL